MGDADQDQGRDVVPRVLGIGSQPVLWHSKLHPLEDVLTRYAIAALVCGGDLISERGFNHTVSGEALTEEEMDTTREVTWLWDGKKEITFSPAFAEETITIQEFRRRIASDEWFKENRHHPIAYCRVLIDRLKSYLTKIQEIPPGITLYRDDVKGTFKFDATEEEIDETFAQFDK